jgi:hypothetical protein
MPKKMESWKTGPDLPTKDGLISRFQLVGNLHVFSNLAQTAFSARKTPEIPSFHLFGMG